MDRVVAVIGDQIILLSEVRRQLEAQMMERYLDYRSDSQVLASLQTEVVEAMVNEQLLQVKAERDSIVPDQRDIDSFAKNEYARIRKQFPEDSAFQKALDEVGLNELQLRYMYQSMARKTVIQQMMLQKIEQSVSMSPQELEVWFEARKDSLKEVPEQFRFSHIMISPKVSDAKKQVVRKRLEGILQELKSGADFADLANKYSEIPGGVKDGGDIGFFKRGDFDERFTAAAFSLKKGEVSDIVETELGMHLIKVEDIRGDEVRARHIVFLLKEGEEDEGATIEELKKIREEILAGKAAFDDMAKKLSEDTSTRDFGGKTKWITRGEPNVPASFLEQASKLKEGEISLPFKSEYNAIHILRLDGHKAPHSVNLKEDRALLESLAKQEKIINEFERIFVELRKETYIDIRPQ
ncbi:MAG: peptidylprolyl isomerase [Candidatus Latescibacterota bacterium]